MTCIRIFVPGKCQPQGSVKGFPIRRKSGAMGVSLTTDNKSLYPWREAIRNRIREAQQAQGSGRMEGGICICAEFILPRPSNAPKTPKGKPLGAHLTKPDCDKLARALGDACTDLLFADDSQIVEWHTTKRYALIGETPGVQMEVSLA